MNYWPNFKHEIVYIIHPTIKRLFEIVSRPIKLENRIGIWRGRSSLDRSLVRSAPFVFSYRSNLLTITLIAILTTLLLNQ